MPTKSTLRCKTPAKAQVNFRKHQRKEMNRAERRKAHRSLVTGQCFDRDLCG